MGKTAFMLRYVEGNFDDEYIETSGVNFMEKSVKIRNAEIIFSLWDLGGSREFAQMHPLVCNDALVVFFMFDLTRKSTLQSIKEWYRQVRTLNMQALAFLIGTKFDLFVELPESEQEEITKRARRVAAAMRAPLIFSSSSHAINVQKSFKIVFGKLFGVDPNVERITSRGEPIVEY